MSVLRIPPHWIALAILCGAFALLCRFLPLATPPALQVPSLVERAAIPFENISICSVAFTPDGSRLVVAGITQVPEDRTRPILLVRSIDKDDVVPLQREGETGYFHVLSISPDGRFAAVGGALDVVEKRYIGNVCVWDLLTLKLHWFAAPKYGVSCLAWSPDGSRLAAGNASDGTVTVWNVDGTNERIAWQPRGLGEGGTVVALAWSNDGKRMLMSSSGVAHLWDIETGREVSVVISHPYFFKYGLEAGRNVCLSRPTNDNFSAFAFTQDSSTVYVAGRIIGNRSEDDTAGDVWVWDLATNRDVRSVAVQPKRVWGLHLRNRGRSLVTTSYEHSESEGHVLTAQEWDLRSGRNLWRVAQPTERIWFGLTWSSVSSDGSRLALVSQTIRPGGNRHVVHVYDLLKSD